MRMVCGSLEKIFKERCKMEINLHINKANEIHMQLGWGNCHAMVPFPEIEKFLKQKDPKVLPVTLIEECVDRAIINLAKEIVKTVGGLKHA